MLDSASPPAPGTGRPDLRRRLLAERSVFVQGPDHAAAEAALARHLTEVVARLEPACLGLYWPMRSEFNAPAAIEADARLADVVMALPFVRRNPREMHYRRWNRQVPTAIDECAIPTSDGAPTVPDVVLAPCVGFTSPGYRLGYGGGYFDRWLALHPHVTTIGVSWALARLGDADFTPQAHDRALDVIVTEAGVV